MGDILKMYQKHVRLFKWDYMINDDENEAKNEKSDHKDMAKIDKGLDMDTNKLNIKCMFKCVVMVLNVLRHA